MEIKNCPKCGNKPRLYTLGPKQSIYCTRCGRKIEKLYTTKEAIISEWNKQVN